MTAANVPADVWSALGYLALEAAHGRNSVGDLALFLVDLQERADDPVAQVVLRVLAPAAKFWVCRRAIALCAEAMETWGGNGYIEDGPMPRLLRERKSRICWTSAWKAWVCFVMVSERNERKRMGFKWGGWPVFQEADGLK